MLPVSARLLGAGQGGWAGWQLPLHQGRACAGDCREPVEPAHGYSLSALMICTAKCPAGCFVLEDKAWLGSSFAKRPA